MKSNIGKGGFNMAKKGIPKKDGSGGGIRSNKNTKPCKNGGPGGSKGTGDDKGKGRK